MSIDEVPSETPPRPAHDFSNLQGLQVVRAHLGAIEDHASEAWREALRLELEARAARFHHAVDESIVLSDDGVIRWLGDPVARLAVGDDLMAPRALVLADASLPESARETVVARLELWLAATTRRLLGPLLALRSLQDESEPVRRLAAKIAESFGVLEREPLRNEVKALDQNSRAALRRHGVRFGAYYIYLPQLLKPAPRALALQLWSVRMQDASGEDFARRPLTLASTGRTSLPVNPLISRDGYRVAGFRPCGERVVRVDIVERLSDMIRAASVPCSASDASQRSAFVVSGQMTSLTGCSGDAFASILRSFGYESFEIERSRLASPQLGAEAGTAGAASPDHVAVVVVESVTEEPPKGEAPDCGLDKIQECDDEAKDQSLTVGASPAEAERANGAPEVPLEPVESVLSDTTGETAPPVQATVIAWRLARRQRPERENRRPRRSGPATKASLSDANSSGETRVDFGRPEKRERRTGGAKRESQRKGSPSEPKREGLEGVAGKRPRSSGNQNGPGSGAQFESSRRPTVDPTSPFAKLLELRTVLEKQTKNR